MRQAFAKDAVLSIEADGDLRAPGAAITVALCGHWEHEPPCPLAPHQSSAERVDDEVHLRTLFVVEPACEDEGRERIRAVCVARRLGQESGWHLRNTGPAAVRPEEADHARLLAGN